MAQIIKLKRSQVELQQPTTSSLDYGELAINYADGKVFFRKSDDTIQTIVATNTSTAIEGDVNISGSVTASFFKGDGSALTNLTIAQTATVKQTFTNSVSWSVQHNLDTENPIAQVYDSDDFQIIPKTLKNVDPDNILITFENPRSGYVVVAKGGQIVSGSILAENVVNFDTRLIDEINAKGVFSGSEQVVMGGDVTGTANNTTISQIDGGGI